MASINTA